MNYGLIMAFVAIFGLLVSILAMIEINNEYIKATVVTLGFGLCLVAGILSINRYLPKDSSGVENLLVENVLGFDVDVASAILKDIGFEVKLEFDYSSTIEERHVISQSPKPLEVVPPGTTIDLYISIGPGNSLEVPDDTVYDPPDDTVYDPPGDTVYDPPEEDYCTVPNLVGQSHWVAEEILLKDAIEPPISSFISSLTVHYEYSYDFFCHEVIKQSPKAGLILTEPVHFEYWVSKGPRYFAIKSKDMLDSGELFHEDYWSTEEQKWVDRLDITTYEINFVINVPSTSYESFAFVLLMPSVVGLAFSFDEVPSASTPYYISQGLYLFNFEYYENGKWHTIEGPILKVTKDETFYLDFTTY